MGLSSDADHGDVPGGIFAQPWWLDAVAPGAWGAVTIEQNGALIARFPYVMKRQRGRTYLVMPPLTPRLGPWLRPFPGKNPSKLAAEKKMMSELIDRLPPFDRFMQHFHPSVSNWLPFFWRGFQQTTRYTYVIEPLSDLAAVWEGMSANLRRNVRNARTKLAVRDDLGLDAFLDMNEKTFRRQGLPVPYGRDLVARFDDACSKRRCRRILFAEDPQGRVHAAAYFVWDSQAAYWLMGGGDPELRSSGATSLLVWEAIEFAATVSRSFDFVGSMIESVEHFIRTFGATQKPYLRVSKTNSPYVRMSDDFRTWMTLWRGAVKSKLTGRRSGSSR
jgi:Acetyltransferase (GNAT) domain